MSRPELDDEARFSFVDAVRDVVCFHFRGASAVNSSGLVRDLRIRKRSPNNARPSQFLGDNRVRRTDIRLWVEAETENLGNLSDSSNHRWIEMLF